MESEFKLMELPYPLDSLSPYMSKETLEYHYLKHHKTYVDNLNNLLLNNNNISKRGKSLYDIIRESKQGPVFNNAAQIFNHNFFWLSLTPNSRDLSDGILKEKIIKKWGSIEKFKEAFNKIALGTFGSGWVWLVSTTDYELDIISSSNADTPITGKNVPLLTCDVWEHAYYIDYRNSRANYLNAFWKIVNWEFIESNFKNEKEWNNNIHNRPNF